MLLLKKNQIQNFFGERIGDINVLSGATNTHEFIDNLLAIEKQLHLEPTDIYPIEDAIVKLESKTDTDFILGTTTTGPHRDGFKYNLLNRDFAKIASTGQIRLISLVLRIAQSIFFFEKTKRKPLLLLDDVLLELDNKRRMKFLEFLPEYEQIFFTFLPGEHYNDYRMDDTLILNVKNGVISR